MKNGIRATVFALVAVFLMLLAAGVLGALVSSTAGKFAGLVGIIVAVGVAAFTHDAMWWARKGLWTRGRLWVNPFGARSADAPPLIWQRR